MKIIRPTLPLLCILLSVATGTAQEAEPSTAPEQQVAAPQQKARPSSLFFDEEDGMLDLSDWLLSAKGFFTPGGFITEPAVGNGLYLGLVFIHDSIQNRAQLVTEHNEDGTPKRLPPPSISALVGFGTSNGSWGSGLAHMHVSKENRYRYLGALMYTELALEFYGTGNGLIGPGDPIDYDMDSYFFLQQLTRRMGDSDFFLGGNYVYLSSDVALDIGSSTPLPPWFPALEQNITSAGVGLIAEYDTRNSIFTPDSGINAKVVSTFFGEAVGSEQQYNKVKLALRGWHPLGDSFVLGLRGDANFSGGDIPFYMLPSIDIRGISKSRYQGQHTAVTEAELRWDLSPRWSLIGFGGIGWTAESSLDDYDLLDGKIAGGTGFRYLLSKVLRVRSGMDFSWSEEEFAFYFTTGSAWF